MKIRHTLSILSLAALTTLAAGCNGSTPTEPVFNEEALVAEQSTSAVAGTSLAAEPAAATTGTADKRRGADDAAGDDRGGRGRGSDDSAGQSGRRGRGQDDGTASGGRGRGRGGRGGNGGATTPTNPTRQPPRQGQEFESAVVSVNGSVIALANGTRVTVNGQTQWNARGDLFNLSQVARAVAARRPTRVEGRGTRQANGVFLATTIKAEVDD